MTDFNYKAYLASREWALLREQVRERSGGVCERCLVLPQAAVHHLTYERTGHEDLTDLQAVCGPCHAYVSARSPFDPEHFVRRLPFALGPEAAELIAGAMDALDQKQITGLLMHTVDGLRFHAWSLRRELASATQIIEQLTKPEKT